MVIWADDVFWAVLDPIRSSTRSVSAYRDLWVAAVAAVSLGLDVARADHLGPLLDFFGDQLAAVGRRA